MTAPEESPPLEAPLATHLVELRHRLLWVIAVLVVVFGGALAFADRVFLFLVIPFQKAMGATGAGQATELIYTAPHEFFFTKIKLAFFASLFLSFPFIAFQLYRFVAPGLYRRERRAFLPFLIAAPVLFIAGGALVYFLIMPLALQFFLSMEYDGSGARIFMLARVSEYLGFTMTLMVAFGLCFQLPIVLMLMARAGLVTAAWLRRQRRYALVAIFAVAAILTPPDLISQIGLGVPTFLLYEASILAVALTERKSDA